MTNERGHDKYYGVSKKGKKLSNGMKTLWSHLYDIPFLGHHQSNARNKVEIFFLSLDCCKIRLESGISESTSKTT